MQRDRYATVMGDRLAVRFIRPRTLAVGAMHKSYEPGDTLLLPRSLAYELVDAGDAVLDRNHRELVQKDASPHRTAELAVSFVVEKRAGSTRQVRAVCSTATPDRHGDVVEPAGLALLAYRANPVVLWQHSADTPIARAEDVRIENNKLLATFAFPAEGASEHSDRAWRLIEAGVVRGVSVGFLPTKLEPMREGRGYRIRGGDLLEISVVSVPANADCLLASEPVLPGASRGALLSAPPAGAGKALADRQAIVAAMRGGAQRPAAQAAAGRTGQLARIEAAVAAVGSDRPKLAARLVDLARIARGGMVRKVIGRGSIA